MTEVKPEQSRKASSPILVTEFGMITEIKPSQAQKAYSPMLVTDLPIVTEVKPEHSEYLDVVDYQLFAVNTVEKWIGCHLWVYGK